MFCYVLDINQKIEKCISAIAKEKKLTPFYATLTGKHSMSIEQWLRSFMDSEYIVTDSYHGMVFSLIFNKPFYLLYNDFRGNARFDSLIRIIDTPINMDSFNWEKINKNIIMAQLNHSGLQVQRFLRYLGNEISYSNIHESSPLGWSR